MWPARTAVACAIGKQKCCLGTRATCETSCADASLRRRPMRRRPAPYTRRPALEPCRERRACARRARRARRLWLGAGSCPRVSPRVPPALCRASLSVPRPRRRRRPGVAATVIVLETKIRCPPAVPHCPCCARVVTVSPMPAAVNACSDCLTVSLLPPITRPAIGGWKGWIATVVPAQFPLFRLTQPDTYAIGSITIRVRAANRALAGLSIWGWLTVVDGLVKCFGPAGLKQL